ncbi:MAG: hypothetical protein MUF27_09440 [Acidobacteria bacterium]|nr:hypothetical protein [Acidobacteriota bacterium]
MSAAVQHRAIAVRLAKAAEHLVRAALEANDLGPEWDAEVRAWNREADVYLRHSLDHHELAYRLESARVAA